MNKAEERLERLRRFNASIQSSDPALAEEMSDFRLSIRNNTVAALEGVELDASDGVDTALHEAIAAESIVLRRQRPILAIANNQAQLVFQDKEDSAIWKKRLQDAGSLLEQAVRAVGRIELAGGDLDWVGTGWLVGDDILVTNRHVALEFARRDGDGFSFKMGDFGQIRASVDFLEEIENPAELVFKLIRPLFVEDPSGPDLAFFQVEIDSGDQRLAKPLQLAARPAVSDSVAVIGYPAYDSRIPDLDLMENLFGRIYDKKRLAPGAVTFVEPTRLLHNCTTLGGNSGSCVIDLTSGEAVGLHFSGRFMATNYAVPSDIVQRSLEQLTRGRQRPRPEKKLSVSRHMPASPQQIKWSNATPNQSASITIPITLTLSLGVPALGSGGNRSAGWEDQVDFDDDITGDEGRVEDYLDRDGYRSNFLSDQSDQPAGEGRDVPLPRIGSRHAGDVLSFDWNGEKETELRYEHFSVVMSRSRRMCFFSAVNIDGQQSKKTKRANWRWDPRIPREQQIMNECYGDPPRFSRGHMSRREDPAWGNDISAKRGNQDSMHVTNAVPQMQAFNAPIWLELEDYALGHAREDDMKISVFTGPYFTPADPVFYGVRVPLKFWKIIVFIHDETKSLCATGYEMSQEQALQPEEEFVFGAFTSSYLNEVVQLPIASIARKSGLDFGMLSEVDPLGTVVEGPGSSQSRALKDVGQIRFY